MKLTIPTLLLSSLLIALPAAPGHAALLFATASLDGAQEVGPGHPDATGFAAVRLDTLTLLLDLVLDVRGIALEESTFSDGPLAFGVAGPVHIHRAPVGVNGDIIVPFPDPSDYVDLGSGYAVFADGIDVSGVPDFVSDLLAENLYLNVHTLEFPGGAIRGQLVAEADVPEPATLWLLGGLGALLIGVHALTLTVNRSRRGN